jgi:hypothetical protein
MAIFVGAAGFALAACRSALDAIARAKDEQQAIDLARARMAELELGSITLADLRDGVIESIGSFQELDAAALSRWRVEVATSRTEYAGLTLVELTVREETPAGPDDPAAARFTLRQLMRLRGDADQPDDAASGTGVGP